LITLHKVSSKLEGQTEDENKYYLGIASSTPPTLVDTQYNPSIAASAKAIPKD